MHLQRNNQLSQGAVMQRSIFSKYFAVCAALIIVSIVVLGAVFLTFASQYLKSDKLDLMKRNADRASQLIREYWDDKSDPARLQVYLHTMADTIDADLFVTDRFGATLSCTEIAPCPHTDGRVQPNILQAIRQNGSYAEMGKLGSIYDERYYTVGVSVETQYETVYVFVSAKASSQQKDFFDEMVKIFLISATTVLILTSIAIYFITIQLTKPLRQMADAAKRFGRGEFDTRLEVTGYDEVGQLAMALNNMAQSLSTSESARRSFTANVSHELKTPMTTISGFVDGILDGTIPPEQERHYLTIVSGETKRLSRLVRTMLNLSKIEAGEMQIKRTKFNVVETICQALFLFEKQIDEKQLDVRGLDHDKVMVEADPDLIHQVCYNLIENAVKFVNKGGYLEFSFSSDVKNTYISVKNSGAGLSKEEIPKVFDRFYKSDRSRGLDKNGVGLGLYIVRSIVNLHGGEIIVRSNEGEFVEFAFSVPNSRTASKFKKNS